MIDLFIREVVIIGKKVPGTERGCVCVCPLCACYYDG
jgi:hypothetical protein